MPLLTFVGDVFYMMIESRPNSSGLTGISMREAVLERQKNQEVWPGWLFQSMYSQVTKAKRLNVSRAQRLVELHIYMYELLAR